MPGNAPSKKDVRRALLLRALNERGRVEEAPPEALFRFQYLNHFYGSCTFLARLVARGNGPLSLDHESIRLEGYRLRRGNLSLLLQSARVFFQCKLLRFRSPADFGD